MNGCFFSSELGVGALFIFRIIVTLYAGWIISALVDVAKKKFIKRT